MERAVRYVHACCAEGLFTLLLSLLPAGRSDSYSRRSSAGVSNVGFSVNMLAPDAGDGAGGNLHAVELLCCFAGQGGCVS